jgi:small subunit ribosomal protein S12
MPTINQLVNKKRISKKINLKKTPALKCNPQKHGTCISVFTKTPRKPNSALRKVAKVRLVNGRIVIVYIPGEGHNISRFSDVLVAGRRVRDLPGVKYGALRGKFDLCAVSAKKNGRSKYGSNKEKKNYIEKSKKKRNRFQKNRFYY